MEVKHEPDHSTNFSWASSENQRQSTNHSFRCTHLESCGSIIVKDFEQEGPLWMLTCYGHWKSAPCDIVGDISYEELRAAAYDDDRRGSSLLSIVVRERKLVNSKLIEFENLCNSHAVPPNPAPANQNAFPGFLAKTDTFPGTGPDAFSWISQGSGVFDFIQPGTSLNVGSGWRFILVYGDVVVLLISELLKPVEPMFLRPPAKVTAPSNKVSLETHSFVVSGQTPSAFFGFGTKHLTSERQDRSLQTQPNDNAGKAKDFVDTITGIFDKDDLDISISIFKVPNSLTQANTEAYVPKLVGLGAIHHLRPELQQMQMYKVMEAKRIHKGFQGLNFRKLIELLKQIVAPSVRASYNMYLEITDDDLACIMAVDGLFLFYLLCCYGIKKEALSEPSFLSQMVDSSERRLAQDTTLREAMMLENQIPIRVLKTILLIESSEFEIVSKAFPKILMGFCHFVSPFDILADYPRYKTLKHAHLLDLLYCLIVLKVSPKNDPQDEKEELRLLEELFEKVKSKTPVPKPATISRLEKEKVSSSAFSLAKSAVAASACSEEIVEQFINIAKDLAPLPLKKPIELVQSLRSLPWSELGSSVSSAVTTEPSEDETLIPTASELHKAGVVFVSQHITNHIKIHITSIKFDPNSLSFHLPLVKLSVNSEVIIRNLAAYEAMIKSETEPLILTRYVELMSGLIRTCEDVKVLKDHGIIKMESISDEQVVKLFNGMSKSVKSTNTKNIDEEIEGVTRYYNSLWKVSARKFINKGRSIAGNWCKVFAAVLLLLLMGFQAFCSVYECRRLSFKGNNSQGQHSLRVVSLRSYM
ncbi:hypothetical protein PanWU01x14_121900 [Parasponia andersonii]|uniref:Transmembrane protein n=1 Tax=Parasponia andersonii TaxID=3476 RepID=A0A2P5CUI0_PARAD|nr:hypothetical protein PanWU01x14_121900 [Parasponia andersonii]